MKILLDAVVADERLAAMAADAIQRHPWGQRVEGIYAQQTTSDLWNVVATCDDNPKRGLKDRVRDFWYGFCAAYEELKTN